MMPIKIDFQKPTGKRRMISIVEMTQIIAKNFTISLENPPIPSTASEIIFIVIPPLLL
jgi:hypothetical protein